MSTVACGRPALPIVRMNGTAYMVDLGQRQFRDTFNLQGWIDFDSVKGERLRSLIGVVTCLRCGMSVIVSMTPGNDDRLRCMRCSDVVAGPFPNH